MLSMGRPWSPLAVPRSPDTCIADSSGGASPVRGGVRHRAHHDNVSVPMLVLAKKILVHVRGVVDLL